MSWPEFDEQPDGQFRILVLGISELGLRISRFARELNAQVRNPGKYNLDITNSNALAQETALFRPHLVINCAEKSNLSDCERRPEGAIAVNSVGAAKVALVCRLNDIPLIHISTDMVFSGFGGGGPYTVLDELYPVNAYGLSKMIGEKAVRAYMPYAAIVRIGSLYGTGIENGSAWDAGQTGTFRLEGYAKDVKKRAYVPSHQKGKPTHVGEAAFIIVKNVRLNDYMATPSGGVIHVAPEGIPVSWYDFLVDDFPFVEEVDPKKAQINHPKVTIPAKGGLVPTPGWETANYALSIQRFRQELEGVDANIGAYTTRSEGPG